MIIVNNKAAMAARTAFNAHPDSESIAAFKDAITAALPHLTDAGEPLNEQADHIAYKQGVRDGIDAHGLDGQYFSDRLDKVDAAVATYLNAFGGLLSDIQAADRAAQGRQDAIYRRLDAITHQVRVLAEDQAAQPLTATLDTTQPTDYEVWRDALQMACEWIPDGASDEQMLTQAEIFRDRLKNYPTDIPDTDHGV